MAVLAVWGHFLFLWYHIPMDLIDCIASFDTNGHAKPLRFRHRGQVVKVDHIVSEREELVLGSRMHVFRCETSDEFSTTSYTICFEPKSCMWWFKT